MVQEAVKAELTALNQVRTVGLLRGWRVGGHRKHSLTAGVLRGAWVHDYKPGAYCCEAGRKGVPPHAMHPHNAHTLRSPTLPSHTTLTHAEPYTPLLHA